MTKKKSQSGRASSAASARSQKTALETWDLRLYVVGDSPRSRVALENLRKLCEEHLSNKYRIEIVDLRERPELAKTDQILAVPTVIRKVPKPAKRIIGDLSNPERARLALDIGRA